MRAFVFTDKALERQAGRFVWLALDTENAVNEATTAKLTIEGVPTLFVIDPKTETVLRRVLGSATAPQLNALLDEAYTSWKTGATAAPTTEVKGPDAAAAQAAYAKGEELFGAGQDAEAVTAFQEALARAPQGWPQFFRTADALVASLQGSQQYATCVTAARDLLTKVGANSVRANLAGGGLDCALHLKEDDSTRKGTVAEFEALAEHVLADKAVVVAVDDRSGIYGVLVDARKDAGDTAGAKRVAGEWAAYLEGEAARTKTADERAVFDPHRLSAYIEMGAPEKAVPMLQQSEKDLPGDYNPPARLAAAYKEMKRWDDGLAAADRALKLAYGPRKVRIYLTRADLDTGKGDAAAARKDLQDAIAFVQTLPAGARRDSLQKMLEKRLNPPSPSPAPKD